MKRSKDPFWKNLRDEEIYEHLLSESEFELCKIFIKTKNDALLHSRSKNKSLRVFCERVLRGIYKV